MIWIRGNSYFIWFLCGSMSCDCHLIIVYYVKLFIMLNFCYICNYVPKGELFIYLQKILKLKLKLEGEKGDFRKSL